MYSARIQSPHHERACSYTALHSVSWNQSGTIRSADFKMKYSAPALRTASHARWSLPLGLHLSERLEPWSQAVALTRGRASPAIASSSYRHRDITCPFPGSRRSQTQSYDAPIPRLAGTSFSRIEINRLIDPSRPPVSWSNRSNPTRPHASASVSPSVLARSTT